MGKDKVTLAQLRQQLIDDGATGLPDEATFAKKMSNSNNRELIRKQLLRRGFDEDYLTDSASFAQYFGFASPLKREQPTKPATANASWQTMQDASDLDEYGVLHRNGQSYSPSPEYAEMLDELKPQKEEEEIPYQEFTTEELKQSDNPVVRGMANRLESSSGMLSGVMPKTNFGSSPTYLDDLGGEHSTNLGATWANNEINRENNTIKAAKAEKQRRIDEIDNEIAEAEQELNRVLSELSNHPDQYAPTFPTVQYPGVHIAPQYTSAESKSLANERDVLSARLRALRETKRITEAAADVNDPDRWWIQNLGRGALDRLSDPNFYTDFATMGASALSDAFAMNRIADKINKGENLTDAERETAIAQSIYQEVSQTTDLPITYTSGDILAEMIPFVVQMWANPASGLTKGLVKGAISKFGKSGLTSFAMRSLARVGGGVAEGAVLANTLQLGNVMADAYDRSTGTFNIDLAKGKELALGEMSDQKGLGESFLKAEGSMIIENFTELFGLPGASKVGKLIKSGTSKALGKVAERLSYPALQSFVNRLTSKETKKLASDFFERTGWHGPIEEIGEEEIGIILNAAFVGDNQFSDLWDAKQQATIALSCGFFGGVMSTVQTGKFAYDVAIDAKIKRKMDTADAIARERLSNDIWSPLKDQFDNATATDRVQIFAGILASKDYNREQKDAIANYMTSRLRYEGRNQANYIYEAEENPRGAKVALKEAHDLGANINTVAGQYDAIVALQETERALRNAFQLDETDNIDSELQDAFGTNDPVEIAAQIEQYPKGVQDVVYDYLIAKAKHDGMMETFNDMVEASSNAIVDGIQSNAHSSGKLIKVQTTDGQECYVIEGNISSRNNVIDADNSDQTVIVRFPETAESKQIAVSSLNVDVYEETADANAFARQQADEYRQQAQAQFQENINGWGEALRQAEQAEAEQASQAKTTNPQQQEEQSQGQEQRQPSAKTEAPATATNVPQQEQEQQQAQSQEQADPIFEEMDPQQATALIFEQLDQEDAVQFVENRRNLAHEQLEELQNNPPQIGIDFNKGRQAKAEWKQAVAKAADNVAFWDAVSGIINQQSAEQTTQEAQPIAQQENATEQAEQPSQESVAENAPIAEPSATEQESVAPQIAEEQPTNEDITPEEDARREPLRQRAKVWEEKTGVKVVLIENEAEIEQESARREVAKSKVMGWYDRKSGKVYLYMPNLMSEEEIDQTFIHEVVIHKGLRGLLKEKAYNKVMRRVFRNMTPEQQSRWKRYPGVNGDIIKAADEFIAHSFETLEVENQSLWQKFIDAIRTALINMGLPLRGPLSMSDATLSSLIRRSYRKMANERAMDVPQEMVEIAEGIPSGPSAEPSFSIKIAPTLNEKSMEYAQHVGVSEEFLDILRKAEADINQMAERINSDLGGDLDAKRRGKRMLPEEVNVQDGKPLKGYSTIFKNGSYGRTMENTLKCLRTLAYIDFVNDVKEQIGRPLTAQESFLASQMLYDISVDPQCLYCYVSLDRKAYDEFLIRYLNQRDAVIKAYDLLSEQEKKDKKAIEALYQDFLASRKDTKEMRRRFNMWIEAKQAGQPLLSASDVATTTRRDDLRANGDASIKAQLKDAEAYAQGASWAKKEDEYRAYTGEILRMPQSTINTLNKEYGLRFYSFSEYSPAFIIENMQMIRDAAIRGLRGLAYTKEIDFAKIFAPTGININISVFGRRDANGNMIADTRQGADWAEAQSLRANYPNVGAVFVATNDADVEWALAQDWIDVVIPFHIVRTGADIANFYEWVNYSSEQADKDAKGRKADISPVEHLNSREQYMQLIEERNLTPRFAKWVDNPNYMKLVNETRRPYNQSPILSPVFNLNEAMSSWEEFNNKGGYYGGWYNVDEQGYQDAVTQVAEDIKEGRTAKDVDYGRQDVPADAWNTKRQTKAQRTHHNRPLTNASQAEQTESSTDEDVAFSTSTEIDELYPNWLEGTTTDSGKHSTQVEGTRKTYGKVGTWIEENLGKDVAILDASSGMGYGTADLRERGFNIEDVEPYQSEERKQNNPATYSSYADIRKQYDYIISNAVLNVIPDDWRSNVLHDMANRLKTGGRMFINTRKAGEEKSIKDKIELDSPQEVLVKRNGRIASYQRFFTPQELKSWVEEELGEGYSVEIANEKNSGTKGLAAVVVTKSDDIAFSIIGEKGASALDRADEVTHRMDNLNIAREMETTGKDAKAIRLATGWERGADGKWRYEIEDIEIKNLEPLIDGKYATLGDVVDGTIFQAYPQLKDIPIDTNTSNGDSGSYDSSFHVSKGTIELGEDFIRSVLVHEIQHAIQSIEGWSGGKPSPNDKFFNEMRDRHKVIMDILSNDYNEAELRNLIKQEQDKAKRLIYFEMYEFMRDGMSMDDIRKFYMDEYDSLDRRQREARKEYLNASGEVESRNAQKRMDMSNEQRRETLLADTEDVAREDQIFLMENSGISAMGTTVTRRKADIAVKLQGRDVSPTQLKVLDAFTTDANNITIDVVDANGEQRSITLKQGQDNRAGVKHSVLRHYETAKNSYTAEDILLIPQVVEQGERKQDGKKVSYKLDIGGVKYTVTTDIKGNHEEFTNFFTNRKPIVEEQGSSNTANQHEQPQQSVSANEGSDNISPLQENGELFKRGDIYDYKTGDKITMQNVNVALYREHGPYGQALNQDVSFRGVVLGWGKDYQIDVERLNENLDKALIILEEYKEHLTSLKSNATTPAQKVIDEQIAKIDASMDWANQTKENPSLFHERWHNAPFLELLRPIAEEVVNAEFPDNPSVVAQQTAEALGVDIEIDETLPAKGSYNTRTGRIRINPHRHSSPQDIERTILHEVIGHGGLQALTGKHFPKLCQLAYKMMTEAQRADLRSRHGNLSNEELGAEFMAELAEQGIPSAKDVPVWRRIVGNLRNILRKLGFTISLSEADIRYMLYSAGRLAENGKLQDAINKATKLRRLAKASQQSHDAIEDVLSPELHRPIEFDSSAENLTIGELGLTDIQVLDAEALEAKRRNLKLARENKHSFGDKFSTTLVDQTLPIAKFIQKIFGFSDIQDAYKWNQDNNPWVLANLASSKAQRRCNKFRDVTMKRLLATVDACVGMLMTQRPNLSSKDAHALFRLYATARTAIERQERKVASAKAKEALDQQRVLAGEISADKAFKYDPNTDYAGISAALKWIGMTLQSWDGHPLSPINWNHEADNLNLVDHEDMTIEQIEKILAREGYPTLAEFVDNIEETIGADANSFWEQTQEISNDMLRNQFEAGLLSLKSYQRLRYGMTFEEIAKQQGFTDVKTLARAKVADTIEELVDLGILTEAEATQYVPYYEHYLPLKGYVDFMQSDAATYGESTKTNSKGRPQAVQSVKGHVHMTTDPIARLCYDVTVAIHNEEDNRWKQTMLNIVRQHEESTNNPSAVILNSSKNGKSIKAFEEVRVERSAMDEHEVIVYENGQPRVLRFADKSVAEAMSPAPVDMGAVMKAINWGNRFIASAYTTRNPAFVIPNVVRDFQAGMQYNFIVGGWKYMWKYVGKVFNESSRRELYRALLFREKNSRYSQWAQEFLDNGGETAYIQVASLDSMAEDIKRTLNSIDEGKTPYSTAKKVGRAMLQNVDRAFGMAELVSRFATFIAARESGKSVTEATLMAKEVSVNFDRKGKASWRKWYPLVSIFQNAAFQALRREKYLYRESAGRYIVYRAVTAFGKFLVSFFTGYMFYCLWWGDDDDEKSFAEYSSLYFSANDHVQSANMIVPITPTFSFSLPVSLDDIAFHKMFYIAFKRIALQSTTGKAYNAEESPMDDLLSIASQFADMAGSNPITVGFGTLAPEFDGLNVGEKIGFATTSNPIIAPWVQSGLNRDYKGDLLHGEPYSEEDKDANHSYDFKKSSVGHNLAKFLSNATGGEDDYRGGWINFYGETIDLFLSSYFGGYADMPYKTYKTIKNSITYFSGEPTEIYGEVRPLELTDMMSDIPVGSRFLKAGLETYQELDIKDHNRVLATKAKEWEGNIVKAYKNKNYEDAKEQFLDAPLSAMPDYFLSLARSETYALAKKYPVAKAYYNTIDDATYHTTEYDTSAQANIIIGQALLWKKCAGENLKKMNFEISSSAVMYKIIAEKFVPMRNKLLKADAIIAESSLSTLRSIDETIVNLYNNADIKEFELPKIIDRYQQLMPNEYED